MFRRRSEAPLLSQAGLQCLCSSLNAPVLNAAEHPVGPARAAIVVLAGEYGGLIVCIAVRSLESGALSYFHYAGAPDDFQRPDQALESALAFAEGMGFLFDDDLVAREGRGAAFGQWLAFTGEESPPPLELEEAAADELVLDEVAALGADPLDADLEPDADFLAELEVIDPEEAPAASPPVEEAPPAPPAARTATTPLTKFRSPAGPPSGEVSGGNELGRIALVRRRSGPQQPTAQILDVRLRLLGGF